MPYGLIGAGRQQLGTVNDAWRSLAETEKERNLAEERLRAQEQEKKRQAMISLMKKGMKYGMKDIGTSPAQAPAATPGITEAGLASVAGRSASGITASSLGAAAQASPIVAEGLAAPAGVGLISSATGGVPAANLGAAMGAGVGAEAATAGSLVPAMGAASAALPVVGLLGGIGLAMGLFS